MPKHRGITYPTFRNPTEDELLGEYNKLENNFIAFLDTNGWSRKDFHIDPVHVFSALIHLDKRVLHYKMYHNKMVIDEVKRVAVLSYWLLKFKPIQRISGGPNNINERFVMYLIFEIIRIYRGERKLPEKSFTPALKRDLAYAITNRDISYDCMTMIISSLTE
jgi:hypothetical protein